MPRRSCRLASRSSQGFGLVEALVAAGVLVVVAAGLAQLTAISSAAVRAAADETSALLLAVQRMEQLRGLVWTYDGSGRAVSDLTTDLSVDPPRAGGGGLRPSPPGTLERDIPGYVDYLDMRSQVIPSGGAPPAGAYFVRRWSVEVLQTENAMLVLKVAVFPLHKRAPGKVPKPGDPGVVWLASLKGRH